MDTTGGQYFLVIVGKTEDQKMTRPACVRDTLWCCFLRLRVGFILGDHLQSSLGERENKIFIGHLLCANPRISALHIQLWKYGGLNSPLGCRCLLSDDCSPPPLGSDSAHVFEWGLGYVSLWVSNNHLRLNLSKHSYVYNLPGTPQLPICCS